MRYLLFICAALVFLGMMGINGYLPLTPTKGLQGKAAKLAGSLCLAFATVGFVMAGALL